MSVKRIFGHGLLLALLAVIFIGVKAEAAPSKVTGVKQVGATDGSVFITWNMVSLDSDYYVEYSTDKKMPEAKSAKLFAIYDASSGGYELTGLKTGATYYVRVSAVDSDGEEGPSSSVVEVVTAPSVYDINVKQTKANETGFTLSWNKVKGANCYELIYRDLSKAVPKAKMLGNVRSYKFTGVSKNAAYGVTVLPARKSSSGFVATYNVSEQLDMCAVTKPSKVTGVKFITSGSDVSKKSGDLYFTWKQGKMFQYTDLLGVKCGYQCQVVDYSGKEIITKKIKPFGKYALLQSSKLKGYGTKFLKVRVRGYATVNKKDVYGPWSDYVGFAKAMDYSHKWTNDNRLRITWDKVEGASNYTVYVSDQSSDGYKKVGTTKSLGMDIVKYKGSRISRFNTYYVKVLANRISGKKKYKSDNTWYLKIY